ncbi:hypothetical protein C5167_049845 [Papaver somniferum]|uniref:Uncharacterized protein n=1 Tax=Papaver somniferum TaxID=3469 RepID=A0A4Y7KPU9_PAPSO|nr:hypothetical protein C5167_049845 [Papaver somniferum]
MGRKCGSTHKTRTDLVLSSLSELHVLFQFGILLGICCRIGHNNNVTKETSQKRQSLEFSTFLKFHFIMDGWLIHRYAFQDSYFVEIQSFGEDSDTAKALGSKPYNALLEEVANYYARNARGEEKNVLQEDCGDHQKGKGD